MSDRGVVGVDEDEHRALLSLIIAGLPEREAVAEDLGAEFDFTPLPMNEALRTLADGRTRPVRAMRPMVLRALFRATRRDPAQIVDNSEQLQLLHEALAIEARGSGVDIGLVANELGMLLNEFSGQDGPEAEIEYQTRAAHILGVPPETTTAPICDDRTVRAGDVNPVYTVEAMWQTSAPIPTLLPWLDPRNWPVCDGHVFFKNMQLVSMTSLGGDDWQGDFLETVEIVPGYPITTPLRFTHRRIALGPSGELVAAFTDYCLTPNQPIGEINPDEGTLLAQRRTGGSAAVTEAKVTKTYAFTNPAYRNWPTAACDTFFGELAVRMASNCARGYNELDGDEPGEGTMPPEDTSTSSAQSTPTVDALVQQYIDLAKKSVEEHGELIRRAAKRISGEKPGPAESWADDLATFWGSMARDTATFLNLHSQILQSTQQKASTTPPPPPPPPNS